MPWQMQMLVEDHGNGTQFSPGGKCLWKSLIMWDRHLLAELLTTGSRTEGPVDLLRLFCHPGEVTMASHEPGLGTGGSPPQ